MKVWTYSVIEDRSRGSQLIDSSVPVGNANVQMEFNANPASTSRHFEDFERLYLPQKNFVVKGVEGCVRGGVTGSPKSISSCLLGACMCAPNVMPIQT